MPIARGNTALTPVFPLIDFVGKDESFLLSGVTFTAAPITVKLHLNPFASVSKV